MAFVLVFVGCGGTLASSAEADDAKSGVSVVDGAPTPDATVATALEGDAADDVVSSDRIVADDEVFDVVDTDVQRPSDSPYDSPIPHDSSVTSEGSTFACGSGVCDTATEYCQTLRGGGGDPGRDDSSCLPIPDACLSAPSCTCLSSNVVVNAPCGVSLSTCTESSGQIRSLCYVG